MTTIQNFKNFLRHGKQARQQQAPHAEPTTGVSGVHAQQQRYDHHRNAPQQQQHQQHQQHQPHYAISDPNVLDHKPLQGEQGARIGDFSAAAGGDNRNVAAQAGDAAARAADKAQARKQAESKVDPQVLERIVAEEREAKGKLPRYPGLERWTLLEKMGDGAFSNVYRAKDNTGQWGEVAIKVVRKFEMNSSQDHLHPDFKKAPKTVEVRKTRPRPHSPYMRHGTKTHRATLTQ
jgi:hypothetical protein